MIFTSYKKIDEVGRIVISKDIRKHLSLKPNDIMKIDIKENTIIIKKAEPSCEFCGKEDNLIDFQGKCICRNCLEEINKL